MGIHSLSHLYVLATRKPSCEKGLDHLDLQSGGVALRALQFRTGRSP
jgi:hypothetical protein